MAGYAPASAVTGAALRGAAASSNKIGAQALAAACQAGRPGASARKPVWGSWMQFPGPGLAKIVASMGYQWILIDAEHGAIGDTEMHNMIPAIAGTGAAPIVRVPAPELAYFKRALDAGAFGVMVPMVETKEQAEAVVRMCKFPPQGMRGCGSPFAPAHFGQSMPEYLATANETTMVIVQIETPLGLKNVNEIAAVPGIDMLFIGPNDLACSMGNGAKNHMDCPDVQEAIEVIRVAAEKAGKLSGIFCISAEQAAARFTQGFQFINIGGDIVAVLSWMGSTLQQANALTAA